jgi:Na+:H+ antiporter, NhaA family
MADVARRPAGSPTPLRVLLLPVERFLATESASGVILIAAALVAFAWANSPWAELYGRMQHVEAGITLGGAGLHLSLAHWVNDGLMAVFFFVVGIEIKRELLCGELAGWRKAALPVVAALGGIGFTMALFIAMLAFGEGPVLDQAKIGVLSASLCAAVLGYLLLRMTLAPAGVAAEPDRVPVTT